MVEVDEEYDGLDAWKAWVEDNPRVYDAEAARVIAERIKARGFTVLLVEQNVRFAATVADRHYVMEHGRVVDMVPNHRLRDSMDTLHEYLGV